MCLHLKVTMLLVEKNEFLDFVINSLAHEQSQLFQLLLSYHFNIPLMYTIYNRQLSQFDRRAAFSSIIDHRHEQ